MPGRPIFGNDARGRFRPNHDGTPSSAHPCVETPDKSDMSSENDRHQTRIEAVEHARQPREKVRNFVIYREYIAGLSEVDRTRRRGGDLRQLFGRLAAHHDGRRDTRRDHHHG